MAGKKALFVGINKLANVIVTHPDFDHYGGPIDRCPVLEGRITRQAPGRVTLAHAWLVCTAPRPREPGRAGTPATPTPAHCCRDYPSVPNRPLATGLKSQVNT